jgi:hypothetical protein
MKGPNRKTLNSSSAELPVDVLAVNIIIILPKPIGLFPSAI